MAEKSEDLKNKKVVVEDSSDDEAGQKDEGTDCGLSLEKLNLGPKKKLLVLCLGGLLFHRAYRYDRTKIPKSRRRDGAYGSFFVYKRPFCEDFLKFCFERFEVGLWSSAREWYIDNALDCIMRGLKGKLVFIWDQDKCTDSGFKTLENKDKPIFLKELKKLWENDNSSLPWRKGQYSASNTLMVDDEPYKTLLNPANTAIFLRQYNADDAKDEVLGKNGDLRSYLEGVASADDVPTYVKEHPFGKPALSSSHTDWSYYSKIIRHIQGEKAAAE